MKFRGCFPGVGLQIFGHKVLIDLVARPPPPPATAADGAAVGLLMSDPLGDETEPKIDEHII